MKLLELENQQELIMLKQKIYFVRKKTIMYKGWALNEGEIEMVRKELVEVNDHYYSTEDITTTTIDGEDAYKIAGTPVIAVKDPTVKWQVMDGGKIVADGLNIALAHETMVKTMNTWLVANDNGDIIGRQEND